MDFAKNEVSIFKGKKIGYNTAMNRTIEYQITEEKAGLSIRMYLRQHGFSDQNLTDLRKKEDTVLVNGSFAFLNYELKTGDLLTIRILEDEVSKHIPLVQLPLDILYEDEDLMVINKPWGMPIHTSMKNYDNTLANGLAYYFAKQNKPFVYRCVNRLDRDTSGLTIVAKHRVSAGILGSMVAAKSAGNSIEDYQNHPGGKSIRRLNRDKQKFQEEVPILKREYLAIVRGEIFPKEGTIDAPIARKDGSILERTVDFEKGERAVTHYKTIQTGNGHSLLGFTLETGRTHQIRVHMKYIGFPLIGDYLYNPDMEHMSRQALHSYKLSFYHPITWEPMEFIAPLPEDMKQIFE